MELNIKNENLNEAESLKG